jgi:hypothetical protein
VTAHNWHGYFYVNIVLNSFVCVFRIVFIEDLNFTVPYFQLRDRMTHALITAVMQKT